MTYLQVKLDGKWEYVFCYSTYPKRTVIPTADKNKALPADAAPDFKRMFPGYDFRGVGNKKEISKLFTRYERQHRQNEWELNPYTLEIL